MARYIDADKFKSNLEKTMEKMHLIGGVKGVDVGAVIAALDRQPTADVVPRAEVEELIRENKSLAKTVNEASELIRKLRSKVEKSKTEVAREIFVLEEGESDG